LLPKCRKGLKKVVLECLKDKSKKKLTPMSVGMALLGKDSFCNKLEGPAAGCSTAGLRRPPTYFFGDRLRQLYPLRLSSFRTAVGPEVIRKWVPSGREKSPPLGSFPGCLTCRSRSRLTPSSALGLASYEELLSGKYHSPRPWSMATSSTFDRWDGQWMVNGGFAGRPTKRTRRSVSKAGGTKEVHTGEAGKHESAVLHPCNLRGRK
jgi:hypothetical protein